MGDNDGLGSSVLKFCKKCRTPPPQRGKRCLLLIPVGMTEVRLLITCPTIETTPPAAATAIATAIATATGAAATPATTSSPPEAAAEMTTATTTATTRVDYHANMLHHSFDLLLLVLVFFSSYYYSALYYDYDTVAYAWGP